MANNINKVYRPASVIKTNITPLSSELKVKLANAVSEVVNKIKETHLN
jgi:hypothetical protein